METKYKVGDKVLLTKPKDSELSRSLVWIKHMDKYNNTIQIISEVVENYIYRLEGFRWWAFDESWLTKIEEQVTEQVIEQVTEQVAERIDWEKRRWDLYKMFLSHYSQHSIGEALNAADRCVEFYKQKKQN